MGQPRTGLLKWLVCGPDFGATRPYECEIGNNNLENLSTEVGLEGFGDADGAIRLLVQF